MQQRFLERMTSLPRMQGPVSADQVNRGKEKEGPRMFWTYAKAHGRSSHYCLQSLQTKVLNECGRTDLKTFLY